MTILVRLPQSLTLETLRGVVRRWPDGAAEITVRLDPAQWVHPAGIVGLACLIRTTERRGGRVAVDATACARAGYWERMGFFRVLGLEGPPPEGVARKPRGRFSELRSVAEIEEVDEITEALVAVTNPTRAAQRVFNHVVSEALNNVCQHSDAEGFCLAQYYPQTDEVRFCIGDFGCGLRHSLRGLTPADDREAIQLALRVGITGRPPQLM